jgi:hypothetical protein
MKHRIVVADQVGTALFAAIVVPAALINERWSDIATIAISMTLFAAGTYGFLASFPTAFERSRTDEIGAANLYLLTGEATPRAVKRPMIGALVAQIIVALAVASIGMSHDSSAHRLNPMAFAVLAPMLGFGLNGLWAARYGRFGPRICEPRSAQPEMPDNDVEMEQNSSHG